MNRGEIETPPEKRMGWTRAYMVGPMSVLLRTEEYADGRLCAVHIDVGNAVEHETAEAWRRYAELLSQSLQSGADLQHLCEEAIGKGDSHLVVEKSDHVKVARSLRDFVFQELAAEYLPDYSPAAVISRRASERARNLARNGQHIRRVK